MRPRFSPRARRVSGRDVATTIAGLAVAALCAVLVVVFVAVVAGRRPANMQPVAPDPGAATPAAAARSVGTQRPNVRVVDDEFDRTALPPSPWQFEDPGADATATVRNGAAEIHTPAGSDRSTHDTDEAGDRAPRLVEPVPDGDFSFDAKFDSEVVEQFQEQGVVVEQDPSHYLSAKVVQDYFRTSFVVRVVSGGRAVTETSVEIYDKPSITLRMTRSGDRWTTGFSYDGARWTSVPGFVDALGVRRVGVFGGNVGNTAPPFTARVDRFVNTPTATTPPAINVWYGSTQTFGSRGQPQPWANVLGDVADPVGVARLTYSVNDGPELPLSLGEDQARLVDPGDFNAEIAESELQDGANVVTLRAVDNDGNLASRVVKVESVVGKSWPLPYTADWATSGGDIGRVAQVADGHWVVRPDGTIRNLDVGYDRLVTIGQASTWSSYVVTAQVTVHTMDPDGSAVGIIAGWQGATADQLGSGAPDQPNLGHPFPAAFLYSNDRGRGPALAIYANSVSHREQTLAGDGSGLQLVPGVAYTFKLGVTDAAAGGSLFLFKVWQTGTPEPANWLLRASGDRSRGSIALVAHRADVSFGTVTVVTP